MQQPAAVDLAADRYTPFIETIPVIDEDFTGATFKMQVRDRRDGGALRADLLTVATASAEGVRLVYAGTDTVANHIAAGRLEQEDADALGYTGAESITLSLIGIRINETTMEAMPLAPEVGNDVVLEYDMHITPAGSDKDVWITGTFTVRAGATQ